MRGMPMDDWRLGKQQNALHAIRGCAQGDHHQKGKGLSDG